MLWNTEIRCIQYLSADSVGPLQLAHQAGIASPESHLNYILDYNPPWSERADEIQHKQGCIATFLVLLAIAPGTCVICALRGCENQIYWTNLSENVAI